MAKRRPRAKPPEVVFDDLVPIEDLAPPEPPPGKVLVMNISKHNVFLEFDKLKPGQCGRCSLEVAAMLDAKGTVDIIDNEPEF